MVQDLDPMTPIRLKNGDEVPLALVTVVMVSLKALLKEDGLAFYELVMLSRDPSHQIFSPQLATKLRNRALIDVDGQPHDSVRSIVVSAVEGEMLQMHLVSPVPVPVVSDVIPDDGSMGSE